MCNNGKRQSPVDLNHKVAVLGRYPALMFHGYNEVMKNPKIVNNGHSSNSLKFKSTSFVNFS
jgi:carbonic anhydrase